MHREDLFALSERYQIWNDLYWIPAFRLLTLMWTQSFLPVMGLPRALVEATDLRFSVFQKVLQEFESSSNSLEHLKGNQFWYARRVVGITLIRDALRELEAVLGETITIEFEYWMWQHFLSQEMRNAVFDWVFIIRSILRASYLPTDTEPTHVPPPASLIPLLPELEDVLYGAIDGCQYVLRWAMPPLLSEILALPGRREALSTEASDIHRVVSQALTLHMLQRIAESLNREEQQDLIRWVEAQAYENSLISISSCRKIDELLDFKHLKTPIPSLLKSDFPSYSG